MEGLYDPCFLVPLFSHYLEAGQYEDMLILAWFNVVIRLLPMLLLMLYYCCS